MQLISPETFHDPWQLGLETSSAIKESIRCVSQRRMLDGRTHCRIQFAFHNVWHPMLLKVQEHGKWAQAQDLMHKALYLSFAQAWTCLYMRLSMLVPGAIVLPPLL